MTTTTESQITSGKAESTIDTPEFNKLVIDLLDAEREGSPQKYPLLEAIVAHIEAVREKDRTEAFESGKRLAHEQACKVTHSLLADRDHFKAIAERQAAGLAASLALEYECGSMASAPNGLGTIHLNYRTPSAAEAAFYALTGAIDKLLSPAQQEPAKPEQLTACAMCNGTGVVDDGEIDCYPNGEPYACGPVKCVKDCPYCNTKTTQQEPAKVEEFSTHEVIGKIIDQMSQIQMLWGLGEMGALVRFNDVHNVLLAASKACQQVLPITYHIQECTAETGLDKAAQEAASATDAGQQKCEACGEQFSAYCHHPSDNVVKCLRRIEATAATIATPAQATPEGDNADT